MRRLAIAAAALFFTSTTSAAEGPPLGPEGSRFETNNYRIDLFQGPVLGGARMTGLGGAYAPIAEGVTGFQSNSAAPAVRTLWSRSWFDYDWDLGVTFPNALAKTDFDNNGSVGFRYSNFVFFTAGLNLQFGNWGIGVSAQLQQYELGRTEAAAATGMRFGLQRYNALLARSFFDGQLMIGAGLRVVALSLNATQGGSDGDRVLFSTQSAGSEAGVLFAPVAIPMRFALTGRTAMEPGAVANSDAVQTDPLTQQKYVDFRERLYLPRSVELPWEVEAGIALQIGRPLNQAAINPHHPPDEYLEEIKLPDGGTMRVLDKKKLDQRLRQRYRALPREKLLIVASVIVFGPVRDAIGVESFLVQRVERSGTRHNISPRIGVEAEPFANAIQIRAGSYIEPTRFARSTPRVHGTLGLEARLFQWGVFGLVESDTSWRVGAYGDVARDYFGWGVTAGVWY
jgi:hypothetical protein